MLILGGLVLIIIAVLPLRNHLSEYETQKHGEFVKAVIIAAPTCLGARIKHWVKFRYNNEIHSKTTGGKACEDFKVGDTLTLKHTEGTDIFLYDTETVESEFVAFGLLGVMGIIFMVLGFKKK
jgi:hypothetical protein